GGVFFGAKDVADGAGGDQGPVTTVNTDGAVNIGSASVITGGIVFNGGPGTASLLTLTTTGDNVRLNGAVTLNSDLAITTGAATAGDIVFTDETTINSQTVGGAEVNDLTLTAGLGKVEFNANLGATQALNTLTVTRADGGVFFGAKDVADGAGGDQGPVTTVNTDGAVNIGSASVITGGIVFNGGPGTASLLTLTTTGDNVRLNGAVTLNSDLAITTGAATAGDIVFTDETTINSQTVGGAEVNDLTLTAGLGKVEFNANLGATQALNTLTVTRADGGVFFGAKDVADGAGGDQGPVTTVNTDGAVNIGSASVITGGIVFNGGPGTASLLTLTTTGDNVRLNGAVTLNSDLAITTGAATAGDIVFTDETTINSQTVGGAEVNDLTLTAGLGKVEF